MNLEAYLVDRDCTLDDVKLYWGSDGHFIDYRPEMVDMVPVFPDFSAHVSELSVIDIVEDEFVKLTLDFDL